MTSTGNSIFLTEEVRLWCVTCERFVAVEVNQDHKGTEFIDCRECGSSCGHVAKSPEKESADE